MTKRLGSALKLFIVIFAVGIPILAPPYVAFFSEGHGYSDRVGVRPRDEAIRSNRMEAGALATFSSPYLTDLKLPQFGINPRLWPLSDPTLTNAYLGGLTVILAALAIVNRPRSVWRWGLLLIVAFFLACAVGDQLPLRGWLYDYCPPTRYFRNAAMLRSYAMLCIALLAIEAAKDLSAAIESNLEGAGIWTRLMLVAVVAGVGAILAFRHVMTNVDHVGPWLHRAYWHMAWVWLGSALLSAMFLFFRKSRKVLPFVFVSMAILDASLTVRLARPVMVSNHARRVWDKVNAEHKPSLMLGAEGVNRLPRPSAWIGGHPNNDNVPQRIPTFFNYSVMTNRFQADFVNHPVLVDMSTGPHRIWFSSQAVTVVPTDSFYQAFVHRTEALKAPVLVLHNRADMARVREHDSAASDFSSMLQISQLPAARRIAVAIQQYTPNHFKLTVICPEDGWLLVTDRWSQGWQATVNQQPAEVMGGNFIFRAVRVKAGNNLVEFSYHPAGWPALPVLSWGVLVSVFVVPLGFWRRETSI
jgi:hypothetical protein